MGNGIPQEAVGASVAVVLYSSCSLILCILVVGLLLRFGEKWSYITILSCFTALSTLASILQQLHYAVAWKVVKEADYAKALLAIETPSLALSGPAQIIDVVLFDIQYFCYNSMSLCILFWSTSLFCSSWNLGQRLLGTWVFHAPLISKIFILCWPGFIFGISAIQGVKDNLVCYFIITNMTMLISMLVGSVLLFLILYKYMKTRRVLAGSDQRHGWWGSKGSTEDATSTMESGVRSDTRRSLYDRALVIRFTTGFVILALFEGAIIVFSVVSAKQVVTVLEAGHADLTVSGAISDIVIFIPGATASLVVFLVFGTAKSWRQYRDLITGCFGLKERLRDRRAKVAASPLGTPSNREFEFDRLPSLRNPDLDEDEVLKKMEVASRVRMFSSSPPPGARFSGREQAPAAAVDTRTAFQGFQFHRPFSGQQHEQMAEPARSGNADVRYIEETDSDEDNTTQFGSIVKEDDFSVISDTPTDEKKIMAHTKRVAQRSPEAYLEEDSSDG